MTTHHVSRYVDEEDPSTECKERFYVGVDIGYREHVAAVIPLSHFNVSRHLDRWKRSKTLHFSSDAAGFSRLQHYLDKFSTDPNDFLILLEPTGGYYAATLLIYLSARRFRVFQVENRAVKDYREKVFGSETKTDDTDARLMSRMGFLHETVGEEFSIQPVYLTHPDDTALKVMVQDLVKLQREITRRLNQLQQVVAVTFPELKSFFVSGTAIPSARALLERYPTPQELSEANPDEIAMVLRSVRAYSHANRVEELVALARTSAGARMMVHHQWRQGWLIRQLPVLEQARDELIQQLRHATAAHPYTPIIESLPVKSPIWTASLIAVICDVERFENYSSFKAYMGWYPRMFKSGSSVDSSSLAHKGTRLSRKVLFQMTIQMLSPAMRPSPFREVYNRLVARGMKPATAVGHVAGKLAVVLYGMLKTMTPYDEQKHRQALGLPQPHDEELASPLAEVAQELIDSSANSDIMLEESFP